MSEERHFKSVFPNLNCSRAKFEIGKVSLSKVEEDEDDKMMTEIERAKKGEFEERK
jgi:hypothetical protein